MIDLIANGTYQLVLVLIYNADGSLGGFMNTGFHISTIVKGIFVGSILVAGIAWFYIKFQEGFFS